MYTSNVYKNDLDELFPVYKSETTPSYYYIYEYTSPSESVTERRPKVITTSMFFVDETQTD